MGRPVGAQRPGLGGGALLKVSSVWSVSEWEVSGYTCVLGCTGVLQHCGGWVTGNRGPAHPLAWPLPHLPWGG